MGKRASGEEVVSEDSKLLYIQVLGISIVWHGIAFVSRV
jgi:hypothetical protein